MKYRRVKKVLNNYRKRFDFLEKNDIKIKLVSNLEIPGFFNTTDINNKFIGISVEFAIINSLDFLNSVICHEIAHCLDYILNNGWRITKDGEILYHDEFFIKLCKLTQKQKGSYNYKWFINKPNKTFIIKC